MKSILPPIFLWDEMKTSPVPLETQSDDHLVTPFSEALVSTLLSNQVALFIFLLFLALD